MRAQSPVPFFRRQCVGGSASVVPVTRIPPFLPSFVHARARFVSLSVYVRAAACLRAAALLPACRLPACLPACVPGMFAFVLVDEKTNSFIIARDHMGIIPLYFGRDANGYMWVASELKALHDVCVTFEDFLPGHYYDSKQVAEARRHALCCAVLCATVLRCVHVGVRACACT